MSLLGTGATEGTRAEEDNLPGFCQPALLPRPFLSPSHPFSESPLCLPIGDALRGSTCWPRAPQCHGASTWLNQAIGGLIPHALLRLVRPAPSWPSGQGKPE